MGGKDVAQGVVVETVKVTMEGEPVDKRAI